MSTAQESAGARLGSDSPAAQRAMNDPSPEIANAGAVGLSSLAGKVFQADIKGAMADTAGRAEAVLKDTVLPAAEAGLILARNKMSQIDIEKAAVHAMSLSKLAMAGSLHAADAALFAAKDHLSRVDIQAGVADARDKSQQVMSAVGPAAGKVS